MVANGAHYDYVHRSNSDDSDFEDSFQTIPDDISKVFYPPPAVPLELEPETERVGQNEDDKNAEEPNSYGLQETSICNYSGDHEIEKDFHHVWFWAYLI